ncbi:MAG: hydrogenase expression/formation protein HypE [Atopobiaceae bacterium]|jgi:hydrogenase expression/formation protein HypE|nr:hydrogenase expression/formation protein HypE [Atopobiaceae bacterium]
MMEQDRITLAHGAGGRQSARLIHDIFRSHFDNPHFTADDAAVMEAPAGRIAMSTDGFIVSPAEFPGGNIGKLSICGTVNDVACMGARPLYLTCSFVLEEGFPLDALERIASSMEATAAEVGVEIVAGDTKVAKRGQVDGCFITTAGVGQVMEGVAPAGDKAEPGDAIIVSGDVGRHGCAILLARNDFQIEADVTSDCAPLAAGVASLLGAVPDTHVIRDATRGGVGTVLYEICEQSGVGVRLDQEAVPVDDAVAGVCGMLGLDPLYLACEGRVVVIVPAGSEQAALDALRASEHTAGAALIGRVTAEHAGRVVIHTPIGSEAILPEPTGELLPRIC